MKKTTKGPLFISLPFILIIGSLVIFSISNVITGREPEVATFSHVINIILGFVGLIGVLGIFTLFPYGVYLLLKKDS
ncbi:MAG: hypothetical protein ABII02_03595 [Candidatus Magasanikbacteria bacterium]